MKVIKESYKNFPDQLTNIATSVEGQALEDTEVFDKRKEETEKEIEKNAKLPVDGAPKAVKPEEVKIPNKLTESRKILGVERIPNDPTTNAEVDEYFNMIYEAIPNFEDELIFRLQSKLGNSNFFDLLIDLFGDEVEPPELEESFMSGAQINECDKTFNEEYLNENINEEDAARIVQQVLKNSFGIDADIETYNDPSTKSTIVQFVLSKAENSKVVYDEFKEKLYKRFNHNVNISCKTFSSPNLSERRVEYKIKVLVIKEKKNKWGASNSIGKVSQNQQESLLNEGRRKKGEDVNTHGLNPKERPLDLMDLIYSELSSDCGTDYGMRRLPASIGEVNKEDHKMLPLYPNNIRYKSDDSQAAHSDGSDQELMYDRNYNFKIIPKFVPRGSKEIKDLSFAKVVADAYADYGVKYVEATKPDAHGQMYGTIIIPDEYKDGLDVYDHELEKREEMAQIKANNTLTSLDINLDESNDLEDTMD